jgi:hypothetical protein
VAVVEEVDVGMWDIVTQDTTFKSTVSLLATQTPKFDHSDISLDFLFNCYKFYKFSRFRVPATSFLHCIYSTVLYCPLQTNLINIGRAELAGRNVLKPLQVIGALL